MVGLATNRQLADTEPMRSDDLDKPTLKEIDAEGFRANVGIIVSNTAGKLLWAKRVHQRAWQFPQGGIQAGETPQQALYRELNEEVGLTAEDVELVGATRGWLRYRLPDRYVRHGQKPLCIGQKQKWFLLRLTSDEAALRFDRGDEQEFDGYRWVDYWHPLREVVFFKRGVYKRALQELSALLPHVRRKPLRTPWRR